MFKKTLAGLVCATVLVQSVPAQTAFEMLIPSPITIALVTGQWITKNSKKVYYIEVQSRAATLEQAKQDGFRLAVENAVGSYILSETEVNDGRIKRDEIITYASGFVDKYEIVDQQDVKGGVQIKMKVWVAHNAIAGRLLNESKTAGAVEGERVQAQVSTIQYARKSGDQMLTAVLRDYPARAYNITATPTKVTLDQYRQPYVKVGFTLSMNSDYVSALGEAVEAINQRRDCGSWLVKCQARTHIEVKSSNLFTSPQAWFEDDNAWRIMQQQMILSQPAVQIIFRDGQGREQYRTCAYVPELDHNRYSTWQFVEIGPGKILVNGTAKKSAEVAIPVTGLPVQQFERVDLRVVRGGAC